MSAKKVKKAELPGPIVSGAEWLAKTFLEILIRKEEESDTKPVAMSALDKVAGNDTPSVRRPAVLRADLAAVAVLTARSLEAYEGLARRLTREAAVISMETGDPETVGLVSAVLATCLFTPYDRAAYSMEDLGVIVARDGSHRDHVPGRGNDSVVEAMTRGVPIVGIASDCERYLPSALTRASDYRLVLPSLTQADIFMVIEAITGSMPNGVVQPDVLRVVRPSDMALAIRRGKSSGDCLAKLQQTVRRHHSPVSEVTELALLPGYGEAKTWGMELVADIENIGRVFWRGAI